MLQTLYNFLSIEECDYLINLYDKNKDKVFFYEGNKTWPLNLNEFVSDSVVNKIILRINDICVSENEKTYLDTIQIVKWPTNSFMNKHTDSETDQFSCILYLNDDFEGGQTLIGNSFVEPKTGLLTIFVGSQITHSVTKITQGSRYTLALWYK